MIPIRLGFTYTLKGHPDRGPEDSDADFEDEQTVQAIAAELAKLVQEVMPIPFGPSICQELLDADCDYVFNISEVRKGRNRESLVPAVLELLKIPYSGSDPLTLGITQDKAMAKRLAQGLGIRTAAFRQIHALSELGDYLPAEFSLFVKPNGKGSSMGVRMASLVHDLTQLTNQVEWLLETYHQPVLIEAFLEGSEFSVGILGNYLPNTIPIVEIVVNEGGRRIPFYPYECKGKHAKSLICPDDIPGPIADELPCMTNVISSGFGLREYGRIDFKTDAAGAPYFLEINALPGLSPQFGIYTHCARVGGTSYHNLIKQILTDGLKRAGISA